MTIQDAIRIIAQNDSEIYCKICTVDTIDPDARTLDVTPIDGSAPVLGVNLQANQDGKVGVVLWPAEKSYVVVAFINDAAGVVVLTEQIERIELKIGEDNPVEGLIEEGAVKLAVGKTTVEVAPDKEITFNGGGLGGLVKVKELTDKLNKLRDEVDAIALKYNSHTHITTATIGDSAKLGIIEAPTSTAQLTTPFKRDDYENTKIKHGE